MTTKVLVVNFGPDTVVVDTIGLGIKDPSILCASDEIPPESDKWFYVYQTQQLVVKEKAYLPAVEPVPEMKLSEMTGG